MGFGNLIGAVASVVGGFSSGSSLKDFLESVDSYGIQINSNYEATFSAIPMTTFYIQSINLPSMKQNITQLHFDGKVVEIPQNFEYEHDFSMTVINDAKGYIYSTLMDFVMTDSANFLTDSAYTITIKAIGADGFDGTSITMNGVRIKNVGGLSFNHQSSEIQTFEIQCSAVDYTVTPGAAGAVAGIGGAVSKLLG